jgi:hypothetical protein
MPAAEKGATYMSSLGTLYKVLGFATHSTTNELLVLYSRMKKTGEMNESVTAEPLTRFVKNDFSRIELA